MERITTEAALGSLRDTLPGQAREQAVSAQDRAAAKQVQFDNATAGQKLKAAVGEWDTLNLYRYAQRQVGDAPIDPNFNFKAEAAEVIRDFGLPANDHTMSRLYSAVNSEELTEFALELKEQQDRRELLDNSGLGYSLITGLDPGILTVDTLTWGATRAFRAGKLASAIAGASANTAYLGVVDATDEREVSALEYGLTAGLSAGAFALWGGQRGLDLNMGKIDWRGREISKASTIQQMFNELTTEVDKLTPTPATRDLLMDVIDDPVRRGVQNNNAASNLRRLRNQFDGEFVKYTDELTREVRKLTGMGWIRANADVGGKFSTARDQLEEQVAGELLRRDREFSLYGAVSPDASIPEHITRLADRYQEMHNKAAMEAKRAGLLGFEDFTPRPGYFHRSWNANTFLAVQRQFEAADPVGGAARGRGFLRDMFVESLRNGPAKLTRDEAKPIAQAMLVRMDAKRAGTKTDFLGSLGKTDTEAIREMLVEAGTDDKTVESIMRKIEGRVSEAGAPRYGKSRLPFDMLTEIQVPLREGAKEFVTLRMRDFIDLDLSRLADNYLQQMAGRTALAAAGVGGDDASIAALRKQYHAALTGAVPSTPGAAGGPLAGMVPTAPRAAAAAPEVPVAAAPEIPTTPVVAPEIPPGRATAAPVEAPVPVAEVPAAAPEVPPTAPEAPVIATEPPVETPAVTVPERPAGMSDSAWDRYLKIAAPDDVAREEQLRILQANAGDNVPGLLAEIARYSGADSAYGVLATRLSSVIEKLRKKNWEVTFEVRSPDRSAPGVRGEHRGILLPHDKSGMSRTDVRTHAPAPFQTALHEILHATTAPLYNAIKQGSITATKAQTQAINELEKLYAFVKNMPGSERFALSNALDNPKELISWGMTNPEFQQWLEAVPYAARKRTLWGAFVDSMRKLLGLPASTDSALAEVMRVTNKLLDVPLNPAQAGRGESQQVVEHMSAAPGAKLDFDPADVESRLLQFDHLMGDFTGMRPAQAELSQMAQRAKSLASSTMLGASGLWQVAEYATLAFRYGAVQTMQEFLRGVPGVRKLLQQADPDLKDELATVLNLDLARDVRIRPWLRQHETFIASKDTVFDRVLHAGKQFTPFLNGMKYIHAHQARMNANLALNRLVKAANGDTSAIKMLEDYGLRGAELEKVLNATRVNATLRGGNAQRMNWAGWTQGEIDSTMNVILRIMDDTILYGRPGQGASFARSGVGQILGQFTTFVSFAHNKLLRGTVQNKGYLGLAGLLAYQYPLTMLVVWANEARKGKLDENELEDIAQKAIGYTAALGFWSDMAGIVGLTGHQAGRSVPVLGLLNAPGRIGAGLASAAQGDVAEGSWEVARGTSQLIPGVAAIPVTQLLLESIKPE